MTAADWCTSTSPRIRLRNGRRGRSWKPCHMKAHRSICSPIATGSMARHFANKSLMNVKEVLSAPQSPWQRAYVDRMIGSIRREYLDHVIVFSEESLRRTLRAYFSYYHR